ncbi:MAG: NAD(P)/FAD-dependent oxidoreductase [Deltaproteobacteria bacterium]|nr:NAD(P)/FAD-dependent oxidoreductase [Deltaproteobacteria bacterium]
MSEPHSVLIVGAGVTGLVAALRLVRQGLNVTLVETSGNVGGLAGHVMSEGKQPVEKYYHFICREDLDLIRFIDDIGLTEKISWRKAKTGIFIENKIYPFNTPQDLLAFSPIPVSSRLRFGFHIVTSQFQKNWKGLDKKSAKPWLINRTGMSAYMAVWDPLLRIKFGAFHEEISAAWVWHRIHRVSRSRENFFDASSSYGFLEQGSYNLIECIQKRLSEYGNFCLRTNSGVSSILIDHDRVSGVRFEGGEIVNGQHVISTCAIPNFLKLVDFQGPYREKLASIKYLNIVCALFELSTSFSENFWLNINDPRVSFNGIVETTNLNARPDLKGRHLVYIPYYLSQNNPRWSWDDAEFYNEYISALKVIKPDFNEDTILNFRIFRDVNAQAVCKINFSEIIPDMLTPIKGLYVTDSAQYYPEDRTLSASVRLGERVSELLIQRL